MANICTAYMKIVCNNINARNELFLMLSESYLRNFFGFHNIEIKKKAEKQLIFKGSMKWSFNDKDIYSFVDLIKINIETFIAEEEELSLNLFGRYFYDNCNDGFVHYVSVGNKYVSEITNVYTDPDIIKQHLTFALNMEVSNFINN